MKLTDYEKEMFDGVHGRAQARALHAALSARLPGYLVPAAN